MRSLGFNLLVCSLFACSSTTTTTVTVVDSGADVATDDGSVDAGVDAPTSMCTAAVTAALKPINSVAMDPITIVSQSSGVKTIYVDATAGGFGNQDSNPRQYLDLASGKQVAITDVQARTSTAWDLAFKRPVIFTNSGDAGPGQGGLLKVQKAFDQVTAADATGTFIVESFVDKDCNPKTDQTGDLLTSFSGWYAYDQNTMKVTPKANTTYIVRGGTGKLYKMAITNYYGVADGGSGTLGADYLLTVAGL